MSITVDVDMETSQRSSRLAIAGLSHRGRYFEERWRLLRDDAPGLLADGALPAHRETVVLLTGPLSERCAWATRLLTAGYPVVVEPPLAPTLAEAQGLLSLAKSRSVALRVIALRRIELDFLAACAALVTGRMGTPIALRWQAAEYAVWAGDGAAEYRHGETLSLSGPPLFDQLAGLTTVIPETIIGHAYPAEDGFAAEIVFADGSEARLELRRTARAALRTGWMIEGATGAYHQRKLITTTADGELVDETVPFEVPGRDPLQELAATSVLEPMSLAEQQRCLIAAGLFEAVQRSVASGKPVFWRDLASSE